MRTALEMIDENGLDHFGLEALAARLQVRAPSLYHHFTGREAILRDVARLITFEAEPPTEADDHDWKWWFLETTSSFRRSVLRHPKAAPLLLQFYPRGFRFTLSSYERGARLLEGAGIPADLHAMILDGLDKITFGSALFAATGLSAGATGLFPGVDGDRDPALVRAVHANRWHDEDELFRQMLACFLDGAAALAISSTRPARKRHRQATRGGP